MFDIANNTEFLTAIGINNAPEEVKEKLIAGIENLAQQRLITKLSDKLTDEQQAADWLNQNIPDFADLVTEVFSEIKNEILEHKMNVVGQ